MAAPAATGSEALPVILRIVALWVSLSALALVFSPTALAMSSVPAIVRAEGLAAIALEQLRAGDETRARETLFLADMTARSIHDDEERDMTLARVAQVHAEMGDADAALGLSRTLTPRGQALSLARVALVFARQGHPDRARDVLAPLRRLAETYRDDEQVGWYAWTALRLGQQEEAVDALQLLQSPECILGSLIVHAIVSQLHGQGDSTLAKKAVARLEELRRVDGTDRCRPVLLALARAGTGDLTGALRAADAIDEPMVRGVVLLALSVALDGAPAALGTLGLLKTVGLITAADRGGLRILEIGAAEELGLGVAAGDLLIGVNDRSFDGQGTVRELMNLLLRGEPVRLDIERDGTRMQLTVRLPGFDGDRCTEVMCLGYGALAAALSVPDLRKGDTITAIASEPSLRAGRLVVLALAQAAFGKGETAAGSLRAAETAITAITEAKVQQKAYELLAAAYWSLNDPESTRRVSETHHALHEPDAALRAPGVNHADSVMTWQLLLSHDVDLVDGLLIKEVSACNDPLSSFEIIDLGCAAAAEGEYLTLLARTGEVERARAGIGTLTDDRERDRLYRRAAWLLLEHGALAEAEQVTGMMSNPANETKLLEEMLRRDPPGTTSRAVEHALDSVRELPFPSLRIHVLRQVSEAAAGIGRMEDSRRAAQRARDEVPNILRKHFSGADDDLPEGNAQYRAHGLLDVARAQQAAGESDAARASLAQARAVALAEPVSSFRVPLLLKVVAMELELGDLEQARESARAIVASLNEYTRHTCPAAPGTGRDDCAPMAQAPLDGSTLSLQSYLVADMPFHDATSLEFGDSSDTLPDAFAETLVRATGAAQAIRRLAAIESEPLRAGALLAAAKAVDDSAKAAAIAALREVARDMRGELESLAQAHLALGDLRGAQELLTRMESRGTSRTSPTVARVRAAIADHLSDRGQTGDAIQALLLSEMADGGEIGTATLQTLARLGEDAAALALTVKAESEASRLEQLTSIVEVQAGNGRTKAALAAAQFAPTITGRDQLRMAGAQAAVRNGNIGPARQLLHAMDAPVARALAYEKVLEELDDSEDPGSVVLLATGLVELSEREQDRNSRIRMLILSGATLVEGGDRVQATSALRQAGRLAADLAGHGERTTHLARIADLQSKAGDIEGAAESLMLAERSAERVLDPLLRAHCGIQILRTRLGMQDPTSSEPLEAGVHALIDALETPLHRAMTQLELGETLLAETGGGRGLDTVRAAITDVSRIVDITASPP